MGIHVSRSNCCLYQRHKWSHSKFSWLNDQWLMLFSRATNDFFYSREEWHKGYVKLCGRIVKKYCAIHCKWWAGENPIYMSGSHLCISRMKLLFPKENYNVMSPFPTLILYICERFIQFQDRSAFSAAGKYVDRSWEYVNRSQTHEYEKYVKEYENWDWGRAIPRKGIHKWDFHSSVGSAWPVVDLWFFPWLLLFIYIEKVGLTWALLPVPITCIFSENQWLRESFLLTDSSQWPLLRYIEDEENETEQRGAQVEGPQVKYTCIKGLKIPPLSRVLSYI